MARRGMLLSSVVGVVQVLLLIPNAFAESLPQAAPAAAQHPLMVLEQHRASVVQRIVGDWTDALATLPKERALTAQQLSEALWTLRADRLLAASLAGSFTTIESILAEDKADRARTQRVAAKNLGDAGADLTYTPVNPCRIADTRVAGGALSANVQRTLVGHAASFATQGGTASDCGMPNGVAAIAMNVYAVNPSNLGFIKLWPANGAEPAVSTVNYQPGIVAIATGAIVPVDGANNNQFDAKSPAAVDLVADVVGYFRAPAGTFFVQGGNAFGATAVLGTIDNNALDIRVNGSRVMTYTPDATSPNIVGGHPNNSADAGYYGQTVAGGGKAGSDCFDAPTGLFTRPCGNRALNLFATIGGGDSNTASSSHSTVAGGEGNTASSTYNSTVAGGFRNTASGNFSTVAGGFVNTASGDDSTVAGGYGSTASGNSSIVAGGVSNTASGSQSIVAGGGGNTAAGVNSFAAGFRAKAVGNGSFVWADSSPYEFDATNGPGGWGGNRPNTFSVRATGGVWFVSAVNGSGTPSSGVEVLPGSGSWSTYSDRNGKANIATVDGREVLDRLAQIPISTWNYKAQESSVRHMGPMAQDFHVAFGVGENDTTISTVDADGVALAAIQGLNAKLEAKLAEKDREIADLRRAVEVLMARTSPIGKVARTR